MQESIPANERIEQLKKTILTLEWDIPNIRDKDLKTKKEIELRKYKIEFEQLLEKNNSKEAS